MFISLDAASQLIEKGEVLHIAGTEALLKKLPKGKWIGGSTEYFMTQDGGAVSDEKLFVTTFPYAEFNIKTYDTGNIHRVAEDAYDNGFSILIVPFDSEVHKEYAQNAAGYGRMFFRNVVGWISGLNLGKSGQTPIAVNGMAAEAFADKAVALHLQTPQDKVVSVNIINIFEQDERSPVIEFKQEGFRADKCLINGKEVVFADYIAENNIDTKLPLVGEYSGSGVNVSFKSVDNGIVNLYAPVFCGIKYRLAKGIADYAGIFNEHISKCKDTDAVFSCNCILNFLYGDLEHGKIDRFSGPITFGEIAYQLINQTLVYVTVK